MKLVTFNIRYSWDADGVNNFIHRAGMILDKIDAEMPDVICFQEVSSRIGAFLKKHLTDYQLVGHGREADYSGEGMLVAVRNQTVEVLSTETVWLSPTPTVAGSRHEGQNVCPRTYNYVLVKEKASGKILRIYNTHYDYEKEEIRILEAKQLTERIAADSKTLPFPVVLTGDLNAEPTDESALLTAKTEPALTDLAAGVGRTFHGFGQYDGPVCKIDYLFASPDLAATAAKPVLWQDERDGIYLSDHYPVMVELEL